MGLDYTFTFLENKYSWHKDSCVYLNVEVLKCHLIIYSSLNLNFKTHGTL